MWVGILIMTLSMQLISGYFQVTNLCIGEYPLSIGLTLFTANGSFVTTVNDLKLYDHSSSRPLLTTNAISVPVIEDQLYSVEVSFTNLLGEFEFNSSTEFCE